MIYKYLKVPLNARIKKRRESNELEMVMFFLLKKEGKLTRTHKDMNFLSTVPSRKDAGIRHNSACRPMRNK